MDPQFPLPSHNEGNGQVAIDMPGCDMNAPFGAPAPWDAANGQDQKQDYMLYVWIGLGVVVVIILLVCCCGGGKSGSSGKSRSFLSRLNPFAKEEPESCCSKYGKYGAGLALAATAVGGWMYYKKVQADAATRKKEEEDSEFAVKVWTISGVAGCIVLGGIWWWKKDIITPWLRKIGSKCGLCKGSDELTAPAGAKDAGAAKSGKGIVAWLKSMLCCSKSAGKPFKCQMLIAEACRGEKCTGTDRKRESPFDCKKDCILLDTVCAPCIDSYVATKTGGKPVECPKCAQKLKG